MMYGVILSQELPVISVAWKYPPTCHISMNIGANQSKLVFWNAEINQITKVL